MWKLSLAALIEPAEEIELAVEIEPAVLISAGSISTSRLNFLMPDIKKRDTFSV